jgi:hypothetical protein
VFGTEGDLSLSLSLSKRDTLEKCTQHNFRTKFFPIRYIVLGRISVILVYIDSKHKIRQRDDILPFRE